MTKTLADLADQDGNPTLIVIAHVTHLTFADTRRTKVHFGQSSVIVEGSISEVAAKLWPRE
jgi:hypothetical protein